MNFRIADTFTASLARLTADEQKAVKTTAFDLQVDASAPGLSFHRIERSKDKHFWSVRVGSDLRLIVHKLADSLLLCFADHHDRAYDWAVRRKLETHPSTGAAQWVEVRETVREVVVVAPLPTARVPLAPQQPAPPPALFASRPDDELLGYGVPIEWLADVRAATEQSLLDLVDHLPGEAAEALLELATGGKPRVAAPLLPAAGADPFDHPDAQRRFRVVNGVEALRAALDAPWEKWTVFLHPEQRQWVEREHNGAARVSGSAGTGKTVVALHRAVHLARKWPDARVLLTTFTDTLAHALATQLQRLLAAEPRLGERIDVIALDALGVRLQELQRGPVTLASRQVVRDALAQAAATAAIGRTLGLPFVVAEWEQVVDAWQLRSWEEYRGFARLGRKTRLTEPTRAALWSIFEQTRGLLAAQRLTTPAALFTDQAAAMATADRPPPFDFAVVDEAQDLSVAQLRLLAAFSRGRPDALFFAGDSGQRIFQPPFSWIALGVDIRGRSRTLRINYRTSHQIRQHADRLLGPQTTDADGNTDDRSDTVSVFNGPPPRVRVFASAADEVDGVGTWLAAQSRAGVLPHEFGVFVRSAAQISRACRAVEVAGLTINVLDEQVAASRGHVSVGTMHLAKGLEFRAVAVMACDDEVIPLQERIEAQGDGVDLQQVYDTERQLLYVACTRARDQLLVTAVEPASEFLDDLLG